MADATSNGKVAAEVAEQAVQAESAPAPDSRPWLHPDVLTPRDMFRAKTVLAGVLDGRSPWDLLDGPDEMFPFLIWVHKSRANPGYTWDEALDCPFSEFRMGDDSPPPTPASEPSETLEAPPVGNGSRPKRRKPAAASNSASSTA